MSNVIIATDAFAAVKHPGKRVSDDEMKGRSFCDLMAVASGEQRLPTHCWECRIQGTAINPLRFEPVDRNPEKLVRAYLYRAVCARCTYRSR